MLTFQINKLIHKILVLSSLKTITKETPIAAMIFGWASPDPGLCANIELSSGDTGGLSNLLGIGKALSREGIAAEKPPPALLHIEPTGTRGDEDLMEARVIDQPGAPLEAGMTTEIVGDYEQVAFGIVGFDVGQKRDVAFRFARGGAARQFLAITHP